MSELHHPHWVSRWIESDLIVGAERPLLSSIVYFGTPANLFLLTIVVLRRDIITTDFLVAIVLGIIWLNLGGYLIWYYDECVLPNFFERASELYADRERLQELQAKYDAFFSSYYHIPVILWILLLTGLFFGSEQYLIANGLFEPNSLLRYLYLGSVVYLACMTGIGFIGVVTTVLVIHEIAKLEFEVDPLHPDGLGGLSTIGYYAIRTTLTFTSGSLLLPLAFIFVRGNAPAWLIYVIVAGFMFALAVSFFYPTFIINQEAQEHREQELDRLRKEHAQAKRDMEQYSAVEESKTQKELVKRLELQRIRKEYQDYNNVRLYPFQIDIIIKLISSVLLPIVFLTIDQYVF